MSKNISVKEGGVSRYFTAQKLRTNLQGGSTCDWVPIDEVDNYVELEELNVTENGIYYPSEKIGISKVTVDVPQQGGSDIAPTGVPVRATAAENLSPGDCVYIISGGSGGTAAQASCSLNGNTISQLAVGREYLYFKSGNTEISRIPLNNLTASPEVYKTVYNLTYPFSRNLISYLTDSTTRVVENVKTGIVKYGIVAYAKSFSQNYFPCGVGVAGIYGINDLELALPSNSVSYIKMINPSNYVYIQNASAVRTSYTHYINNNPNVINVDTSMISRDATYWNVIDNKLIVRSATTVNNKYEFIYYDLTKDDGVAYPLKDKNGNRITTANLVCPMKFNAEGNILLIITGTENGLVMVREDMSIVKYDNITGTSGDSEMFGNYYFDCTLKQLFYVPQESVMGKTNAKAHEGSLGFVQATIPQGTVGVAIELFR